MPVPRELQPQGPQPVSGPIATRAAAQSKAQPAPDDTQQTQRRELVREPFPLPENLAGAAVVTVQVAESIKPTQVVGATAPRVPSSSNPDLTAPLDEQEQTSFSNELSEEEQAYVRELQAIDREVRAHEAAHANTGGGFAGRPTYEYVTGPDGRRYAVSGSVQIDVAAVEGDPEATIRKLETVRRAALAPAQPSGQDRAVAAQAAASIRQAEAELSARRNEEAEELLSGAEGDDLFDQPAGTNSDQAAQQAPNVNSDAQGQQPLNAVNQIADRAFERANSLTKSLQPNDQRTTVNQQFNLIA